MLSPSAQDYLKTIYKLKRGSQAVGRVTIPLVAECMDVSAASATDMIRELADMKLLRHNPYRGLELTLAGEKTALHILHRHHLPESP